MHLECLGAAGRVTGSCHLVQAGNFRVLLDCGMIQGSRKDDELNLESFPFDPASIDAVVLSHAHIDHSGRIPQLIKSGFRGKVFAHTATRALCEIMLKDSGHLQEQSAKRMNRRRKRDGQEPIEPLYTAEDATAGMRQFSSLRYDRMVRINPSMRLRFQDAGHILGSSIVELWLKEDNEERKIVFSGDLGHTGAPIMCDASLIADADLVLMESTYGDRDHRSWEDTRAEVLEIARETRHAKGNILIPAFAVGRSQLLLYWMAQNYEHVADWQIFLDSPMAIRATGVYARYASLFDQEATEWLQGRHLDALLPNLTFTRTASQSMALNDIHSGAIIIAGSGMCTGGRIRYHLQRNIGRPECNIIIVGYQAYGTPGRALIDGARQLRLSGKSIDVAAKVHSVGGLSAHAGQAGLMRWYDHFDGRPPLLLVHGEPDAQDLLKRRIETEYAAPVHIATHGERLDLLRPIPWEAP